MLVVILGALALITVIVLVYVTIGQADQRTGAMTQRRGTVDEAIRNIADYIAGIIGDDRLDTYIDGFDPLVVGAGATDTAIRVREAFDAPSVDPTLLSETPGDLTRRFNPTGGYTLPKTGGIDLRTPTDPWLASSEPTKLIKSGTGPAKITELIDWLVITNVAPSGNFVNLWNLRRGLDAEAGFGVDVLGRPRMSERLTLINPATGRSYPAAGTQTLAWGGAADPRRPFDWTAWQEGAFRPAKEAFYGADQPEYGPYQWCDADGDGFFDSRWFELVDVTDPNNRVSVLPQSGRYRWFVAVRVEDLSGRINVNTATDFRSAPTAGSPAGTTPADVDLRRLLAMVDPHRQWPVQSGSYGYPLLGKPTDPPTAENYQQYTQSVALQVAAAGYRAHRQAIATGLVPVAGAMPPVDTPLTAFERSLYYAVIGGAGGGASYSQSGGGPVFDLGALCNSADLVELLWRRGCNDPDRTTRLEAAFGGRLPAFPNFDPFRGNRSVQYEIGRTDTDEAGGAGDGKADLRAMIKQAFDPRQRVTTVSGAAPILATAVNAPKPAGSTVSAGTRGTLGNDELQVDALDAMRRAGPAISTNRDLKPLFEGYAKALIPHSWRTNAWRPAAAPALATLHFGSGQPPAPAVPTGPLLGLLTAGHLAVNSADSYDRNQSPTAATLLVNGSARATVQADPTSYPWTTLPPAAGLMDLGNERLAKAGDPTPAPAYNVFGIEAQPFIIQAMTASIYTDAPVAAGGDAEYFFDPATVPPTAVLTPPTINGWVSASNPDFLGQVVVFQLTNPFDVDIKLSAYDENDATVGVAGAAVPDGFSEFYIEWGGHVFKLAEVGNGLKAVVLKAGETRVFYSLNDTKQNIQQRWAAVEPAVGAQAVENFIRNQFSQDDRAGGWAAPVQIPWIDSITGATVSGFTDLLGGTPQQKSVVHLWRKMNSSGPSGGALRNDDMLVDRLRDDPKLTAPNTTLGRKLRESTGGGAGRPPGEQIVGAIPGAEFDPAADNRGMTIVAWGSVKRPDDPGASSATGVPRGAIPAWCIEAKWTGSQTDRYLNITTKDKIGNLDQPRKSDFVRPEGGQTVLEVMNWLAPSTQVAPPIAAPGSSRPDVLAYTIKNLPEKKTADLMPLNSDVPARAYTSLYPEVALNNDQFEVVQQSGTVSTLRVADLLLPLGVGPMQAPAPSDPDLAKGWMTLGESLGLALNYSNPPLSQPGDPYAVYYRAGASDPAQNILPKFDRGNLVLDDFAPYQDLNTDGKFTPGTDERRYPGIPLALNVLNVFTISGVQPASLMQARQGLVNINTGSVSALRVLPMVAPTPESGPGSFPWWGAGSGTSLPQPVNDAAPTLVRYRDKVEADYAPLATGQPSVLPALQPDYRDGAVSGGSRVVAIAPDRPDKWNGREFETGIPGVREAMGFGSPGEVMAAIRLADRTPATVSPVSIRAMGFDNTNSGAVGVTTALHTPPGGGAKVTNSIRDDFAEQLLVASALGNTVTARSDYFAVWFVVHGYQESDVENLGANDPLVPSVAKRFLMVVDRSNVTRKGEKPRIVILTEVPM